MWKFSEVDLVDLDLVDLDLVDLSECKSVPLFGFDSLSRESL